MDPQQYALHALRRFAQEQAELFESRGELAVGRAFRELSREFSGRIGDARTEVPA